MERECPQCNDPDKLHIEVTVLVHALPNGNMQLEQDFFEWDGDTPTVCKACGWHGCLWKTNSIYRGRGWL